MCNIELERKELRRVKEKVKERERGKGGRERKGRKVSGSIEERRSQKEEVDEWKWWIGDALPLAFATWSPRGCLVPLFVCLSIYTSLFFFCAFSFLDWWSWVSAWGLVVLLLHVDVDNNFKGP